MNCIVFAEFHFDWHDRSVGVIICRAVLCIPYKSCLRIDARNRGAVAFKIDIIQ